MQTLNAKVSGNVQQANLDIVQISIHGVGYAQRLLWQALERPLLKAGSPSVTHKEKASKPDVSGQPTTSRVKEGEISLRPQKGPKSPPAYRQHVVQVRSLCLNTNITLGFREISELQDWACNAVQESWHNNPHLKRGDELEIKFIIVASEDMTNSI
ncbi:hypothetical protein ACS0TY_002605 [Phlomoides rotata]